MEINQLAGVGPKTEKLLNKLGINTVENLLTYYPYKYNIFAFSKTINENDNLILNVTIESNPMVYFIKKNFNRMNFRVNFQNKIFNVTIFNRAFLKKNLVIGREICLIGKFDAQKNTFTCSDIKFDVQNGSIEPVYHLTNGITSKNITKLMSSALKKDIVPDYVPDYIKKEYMFGNKHDDLKNIHFPQSVEEVKKAKIRLIYEELFLFTFKMNLLKNLNKGGRGISKNINQEKVDILISTLQFKLTDDQDKTVKEILSDMSSDVKMNRLVLGDVGSGKTVVSVVAMYAAFTAGYQSAMMAPTEILAIQHFYSIKKILDKFNVSVDLITGSMSVREKKALYKRVSAGEVDILIGTHAILNENIEFKNLGFIVTDEQHRFGVNQRNTLLEKANNPDILYLSATPIPRTYAMTIYGDLDISIIKSKPFGRKEIISKVYKENEIKEVLMNVLNEIKAGHQIYIISPLVEDNEESNLTSVNFLKEKIDLAYNSKIRTEIIHGKMKQAQKDAIMNDFKNNQIKILISTTVIEVGIDVPNATMIVIFNAERFGLASLHQLRGRVGRNELQSYCFLISDKDNERLKVMEESNDGFYISQKDFELRGHGDLFGTRQHGDMNFKISNLKNDYEILVKAKSDSEEFIKNKAYLDNEFYMDIVNSMNVTS